MSRLVGGGEGGGETPRRQEVEGEEKLGRGEVSVYLRLQLRLMLRRFIELSLSLSLSLSLTLSMWL